MKKPTVKKAKLSLDEIELKKLGERLKQTRIGKGYTSYEQFAFDHNLGRAQYGRYERGTEDIRYLTLLKVLKALGITPEEFFEGFD